MYLICAKCHYQTANVAHCPRCAGMMVSPAEAADILELSSEPHLKPIDTTMTGRIMIGVVVVLGLHLGLGEWVMAWHSLFEISEETKFLGLYGIRFVSATLAAALAGAGRRNGGTGGIIVGAIAAFAWLVFDQTVRTVPDPSWLGLAVIMAIVGGIAGQFGGWYWPRVTKLPKPRDPRASQLQSLIESGVRPFQKSNTHWLRILLATAAVVLAACAADPARIALKRGPADLFDNMGGPAHISFTDAQISLVFMLIAGAISGAGTKTGLRQGALTGMLAAPILLVLWNLRGSDYFPAADWVVQKFSSAPTGTPAMLSLGSVVFLITWIGGWMGSQVMPPLRKTKRLRPF